MTGMAVNGNILVVAYGDGSIQSFSVTGGIQSRIMTSRTPPVSAAVPSEAPVGAYPAVLISRRMAVSLSSGTSLPLPCWRSPTSRRAS